MKCVDCLDYKACRRQNDLRKKRHKCKKANEPFVQTNADRIRAMSDEELGGWLLMLKYGALTPWCDYRCEVEHGHDCKTCLADWLRQPVKDGDNDGE